MRTLFLGLIVAAIVANTSALGQTWPTKPIRAIVPFTAGSASDIVPRTVFEQLSGELGQSIIVENRSGAGGTIGAAAVAKAEPDGYTILANSSAHTIVPSLYPNTPYDPARDFAAIIPLGNMPNVLVVAPSKGFRSLQDLVAAAKVRPGSIVYASGGVGRVLQFRFGPFPDSRRATGFADCRGRRVQWALSCRERAVHSINTGPLLTPRPRTPTWCKGRRRHEIRHKVDPLGALESLT